MHLLCRLLIMLFFVLATSFSSPAFAKQKVGVVGAANDMVSAVEDGGSNRELKIGNDIFFKDKISTDSDGNAQLLFVDRSALTVGANSSVTIDEFVYNPATSSGNMVMQGTKGTFRFIGGALSKKNAVKIKTPVGTIGIRGGIAIVQIDPLSGATNATFVYGNTMTFENMAGSIQSVTDSGIGISVDSPTSAPLVVELSPQQIMSQVQNLAGKVGTSAGAKAIPTEGDIGGGLIIDTDNDPEGNQNGEAVGKPKDGGKANDKKDGKQSGNNLEKKGKEQLTKQDEGKKGLVQRGPNDKGTEREPNNKGNIAGGDNKNPKMTGPARVGGENGREGRAPNAGFIPRDGGPVNPNGPAPLYGDNYDPNAGYRNTDGSVFYGGGFNPDGGGIGFDGFNLYGPDSGGESNYNPDTTNYIDPNSVNNENNAPGVIDYRGRYSFIRNFGKIDGGTVNSEEKLSFFKSQLFSSYTAGADLYSLLQKPTPFNVGYNDVSGNFDGDFSSGFVYSSPHQNMFYYKIERKTESDAFGLNPTVKEQKAFVIGKPLAVAPSVGKQYFNFLPDMGTYFSSSQDSAGFFDYNIAAESVLPDGVVGGSALTGRNGMLVDWDRNSFLSGYLDWSGKTLKTTYGGVNENGMMMDGRVYSQDGDDSQYGGLSVAHGDLFGSDNGSGLAEGFILRGNIANPGKEIETPLVVDSSATYANSYSGGTGPTQGFMAGFMIRDAEGTPSYQRYWNTELNGVPGETGVSFAGVHPTGATIRLKDVDNSSSTLEARFGGNKYGGIDPLVDPQTSAIAENIYALEQAGMSYNGNAAINSVSADGQIDGVLISSEQLIDPSLTTSMQCEACDFVHWGVWGATIENDTVGGNPQDVAHLIPYISGSVTPTMPTTLSATYTGKAFGTTIDGSNNITNVSGTFSAGLTVTGGTASLGSFTTNIAGGGTDVMNLNAAETWNGTSFSDLQLQSSSGFNATVNGALFGPAAENMGGNIEFSNGSIDGTGVYLGSQ